jgi:hypothetical protein
MRLIAPALNSVAGITFAGAEVEDDGSWAAKQVEKVDGGHLTIPRMSAVVLFDE